MHVISVRIKPKVFYEVTKSQNVSNRHAGRDDTFIANSSNKMMQEKASQWTAETACG